MTDGLLIKLRLLTDYKLSDTCYFPRNILSPFITANKQLMKLQGSIILIVLGPLPRGNLK